MSEGFLSKSWDYFQWNFRSFSRLLPNGSTCAVSENYCWTNGHIENISVQCSMIPAEILPSEYARKFPTLFLRSLLTVQRKWRKISCTFLALVPEVAKWKYYYMKGNWRWFSALREDSLCEITAKWKESVRRFFIWFLEWKALPWKSPSIGKFLT